MKKISGMIGVALLVAATILAIISAINGKAQLASQKKIVTKYVALSESKLASGDIQSAINYAKLAIKANPSSNVGFNSYTKALKVEYQPNGASQQATPAPAPASNSSSDDSMGC